MPKHFSADARTRCLTFVYRLIYAAPRPHITPLAIFFCQSVNVVYSIMSRRCIVLYIGETGRHLHERFSEHLRSVRNNYPGFPVAEHFNIASNSLEDIVVCVLKQCSCDNNRCKQQEMHLIFEMSNRWPR